jgi:hypothetical protein
MPGGHHACGSIEHRPEIVPVSQLGLAGCQSHSHRQLQLPLRVDRGVHGGHRRREGRHETVARMAEQEAVIRLDRPLPGHGENTWLRRAYRVGRGDAMTGAAPSGAVRNTLSWAASATRIPSASASHRRVEPSTSVNRNVTTAAGNPFFAEEMVRELRLQRGWQPSLRASTGSIRKPNARFP